MPPPCPCRRTQPGGWQQYAAPEPGYAAYKLGDGLAAAAPPPRRAPAAAAPAQPAAGDVVPPGMRSDILRDIDGFVMSLPLGTSPGAR